MIGQVIEALSNEIKALFAETGCTVLRDTQFSVDKMPLYTVPVIIISANNTPDEYQYIGGITAVDIDFNIKVFFYDLNSGLDEDSGYSADAYNVIDTIRKYIALSDWTMQGMKDMVTNYGFKMTLNGSIKETMLQNEAGIIPGYSLTYNSVGIDNETDSIENLIVTSNTEDIIVEDNLNEVFAQPAPEPLAGSNTPVKTGNSILLTCAFLNSAIVTNFVYLWSGPGTYTSTVRNPVITNADNTKAGTYTVTVTDEWGRVAVSPCTVVVTA